MKVRLTFCAFTKFRKLTSTLDEELNITNKGLQLLQQTTDRLIAKYVRLLYETQSTKTLRGRHITYVLNNLRLIGVTEPPYAKVDAI